MTPQWCKVMWSEKIIPLRSMFLALICVKKKKIVLGITTYNRCDYLQACLESFLQTRNTDHEWVVIVADDGSTDDTLEYLENLNFSSRDSYNQK